MIVPAGITGRELFLLLTEPEPPAPSAREVRASEREKLKASGYIGGKRGQRRPRTPLPVW